MRLSTKSRFAVTAMIDIGLRHHQGPVSLAAISQRQHISISYLEQIFSKMREHGLVESTRGPGGGYALNRDATSISVADIICAVHSPDELCEGANEAVQNGFVSTQELWLQLNQKLEEHMQSITLDSLIKSALTKAGPPPPAQSTPMRGVFAKKPATTVTGKIPNSVFALGLALSNNR